MLNEQKAKGLRAIAMEYNNKEHLMTEEQLAARDYILKMKKCFRQNMMWLSSMIVQTSITIRGHIDYVVIHSTEEEKGTS